LSTLSTSSYVASDTFVCAYNACDRVPINHIAESVGVGQRPNKLVATKATDRHRNEKSSNSTGSIHILRLARSANHGATGKSEGPVGSREVLSKRVMKRFSETH
jgi:hypothetical protein